MERWMFIIILLGWMMMSGTVRLPRLAAEDTVKSTDTAPLHGVLADYDAELRGPDGRVDIKAMVERLKELGMNTYFWLIWHAQTDWDDLKRFLPEAAKAGINVWVYLVPPSETPPDSEPFKKDYIRWAREIALLSLEHLNLTAWVIDDFYENHQFFTPQYVDQMQREAKRVNPRLAFWPLMYFHQITLDFVAAYRSVIDGVVVAYPQDEEDIKGAWGLLNDVYAAMPGQLFYPWRAPSQPGDFVMICQTASVLPSERYVIQFREFDNFPRHTAGYHFKQLLVDDKVVWEQDVAGGTGWQRVVVDVTERVAGKRHATVGFRLFERQGVSNFGVRWLLRDLQVEGLRLTAGLDQPETWEVSRRGQFEAGFGEALRKGDRRFHIPFVVMPSGSLGQFRKRHGDPATPERVAQWVEMCLQMWREGKCDGVVTYCLGKRPKSETFPLVQKLFHAFGTEGATSSEKQPHQRTSASGPLRVHPDNPRYFTDGSGKAVYLTGSHTWSNLQSWGEGHPRIEDWDGYLDLFSKRNHNCTRLWVTDTAWRSGDPGMGGPCEPQPFVRTGPGLAFQGRLKFDLTRLNPAYFDELYRRVKAAQEQGIYVIVMLFDVWGVGGYNNKGEWLGSPWNVNNNINGIDGDPNGDGKGMEVFTLTIPAITRIQEAYVRKVLDTLNGLDNVLYEIINEGDDSTKEWQYHFIRFIREYESQKPKQHPVGINTLSLPLLYESAADFISPVGLGPTSPWAIDPPAADGRKVVSVDSDHIEYPRDTQDPWIPVSWVWKSFTRGLNVIWMDREGELTGEPNRPGTKGARRAMGDTRRYAERMNLVATVPHPELASTKYCLADPGREYLVYLPEGGEVEVDLTAGAGPFHIEWFNPRTGKATDGGSIQGGADRSLHAPFDGDAVVYFKVRGGHKQ